MLNAWELREGAFFDTRSVIISVTGLFFPFITGIIATLMAIIYRVFIGGDGVYAGSLSVFFAFFIGVLFKRYFRDYAKKRPVLFYYIFGLVVHVFVVLSQLTFPYPDSLIVIRNVGPVMITLFPIAVLLLSLAFLNYEKGLKTREPLRISERQYRTLVANSNLGIFQYDTEGVITLVNDAFVKILGTTKEKLIGLNMMRLPNKKLVHSIEESLKGGASVYEGFYQSVLSKKKFPTRVQLSPLIEEGTLLGGIGIVEDLSQEYQMNKKLKMLTKYDSMTSLLNRHEFDQFILNPKKHYYPLSIVIYNINAFQIINRSFGFDKGNEVLKSIADMIRTYTQSNSKIQSYRIGGDEFALVFEQTGKDEAFAFALNLKDFINQDTSFDFDYTVCFGFAYAEDKTTSMVDLFHLSNNDLKKQKVYEGSTTSKKTIDIIMRTLFSKSEREKLHSDRVSDLSYEVAKMYHFDEAFNNRVKLAGRLHDIGKINIHEDILDKTGTLTDNEWIKIKKHPESGFQILAAVPEYLDIANIVYTHHERYDGTGYPRGLKEKDIPLEARIISVVDAYDAMTKTRTYRAPLTQSEALNELTKHAGTQFDPNVVDKFITLIKSES